MKLVHVVWEDARGVSAVWEDVDELRKRDPGTVESVGWLLVKTDRYIVLVPHISDDPEQGCGEMTIPRDSIKEMHVIRRRYYR